MIGNQFLLNGKLFPSEEGKISVDNLEFSYGYGVYEVLKVRNNITYFPEHHIERLFNSAKTIGLQHSLTSECLHNYIKELVDTIPEESFNLKILLVGNGSGADLYIFATSPLYLHSHSYTKGVSAITYQGERQFVHAKTLNMLMSYLAYKKSKSLGAYDAILVDRDGLIREGTRTNLFYTDGQTIYTTPKEYVLDGVTRKMVIGALNKHGLQVIEKTLYQNELAKYQGYFFTSTSSNILPITKIDDASFLIPEIVKKAIKIYDSFIEEYKSI